MPIHFFQEDVSFLPENSEELIRWIGQMALDKGYAIRMLNYIFCSDEYLLQINLQYLDHNYYTDIITFDHSEDEKDIEADVFISIDRIKENAVSQETVFQRELSRVMIHGLLHLIGYEDKTDQDKLVMREKEDACLSLLF